MLAEIITIGDEILIGQIVDTNSAWMGQKLNEAGIRVKQITSVSDNAEHIVNALNEAKSRVKIILITGGLGPTKDDITKKILCTYFNTQMRFDARAFEDVERLFKARGKEVSPLNRKQAEVPEICETIYNAKGTAPGMWFDVDGTIYMSMPGVPYEMKAMMENDVIPKLKKRFKTPKVIHKTILTQGIGESYLSEMIADWEDKLPAHIKLAYLPSVGLVRLRLSGVAADEGELIQQINTEVKTLQTIIADYIYGYENDVLEELVANLLKQNNLTISTAESCTGGYLSHRLTSIPGSSAYFKGSIIAYDNAVKTEMLNVDEELLKKYGAVSEEAVSKMAENCKKLFNTDYALATSGIAGPTGGSIEKPIGTVWVAIATPASTITKKLQLGDGRQRVIAETGLHIFNMLRKQLLNK
jgi:nicotinamide-nucleotide amidase